MNKKTVRKIMKWLGIIVATCGGLYILGLVVLTLMISAAFGVFDKKYSTEDLKSHYNENALEIQEIVTYINRIVDTSKVTVHIEFEDDYHLDKFHFTDNQTSRENYIHHWEDSSLKLLKDKLDKIGCISIKTGEPTVIGFQRSGLSLYSFNIFNRTATSTIKEKYDDRCRYIYYKENVVLEYGGGAVGPQCFPK